jgi:putative copper export protein
MASGAILSGAVLLLGAGVFARWVGPPHLPPAARRLLVAGALLGGVLVVVGSLGDVGALLTRIARRSVDLPLYLDYLTGTRHGRAAAVRVALAVVLAAWSLRPARRAAIANAAYAAAALTLLATIAWISHSGSEGTAGLAADLGHLVGTVTWAGSVLYLAWLPVWSDRVPLLATVERLGRLGLASVAVLAVTGTAMATLHLYGVSALTRTAYGLALMTKLALVAVVVGIAALNRFALVPLLQRRHDATPLRRAVRIESLLLVAVLVATAVLTTREPARHPPPVGAHGQLAHDLAERRHEIRPGRQQRARGGSLRRAERQLQSPIEPTKQTRTPSVQVAPSKMAP